MGADDGQHFSGTLTSLLLGLVEAREGPSAVASVCERVGDARPVDALRRKETWSTYHQFRRLAEAVSGTLGGVETLAELGRALWGPGSHQELSDALHAAGSPEALLEVLPHLASLVAPLLDVETDSSGPGDWRIRARLVPGYDTFPEHCAFLSGLIAEVPVVFGHPRPVVVEEACQLSGAPACTFDVAWDATAATASTARRVQLEVRSRVLEGRIQALQETVAELVSGESVDVVLTRVVSGAAGAVLARGFVLAVDPAAGTQRSVYWDGVDADEAERCATAVLGAGPVDERWTVVDVTSRRARYGRLVALHQGSNDVSHHRLILQAYARVAAAALDSAAVIEEATRQAEMATALLQLSLSLAEIGTTDEMAQRLAAAVPAIVDCDQVVIALHDPGEQQARIAAARGFGDPTDRDLVGAAVPLDTTTTEHDPVRLLTHDGDLSDAERRILGRAAAIASVPLHAGGEVLGWVAVIVHDRAERLTDEGDLGERLRGLAGQAATAMRNAWLVDRIRFQAEHDPLTGLPNQRLLATLADQAIARARRDGSRVGLLFLDLDDFKEINDTRGHAEGDRLLQLVTERLQTALRESDTVARFGGDEFVVLLPALTGDWSAVASKIELVLAERFVLGGDDVRVTTSIGAAVFPDDGDDFGELLKRADIRMYEHKLARRARQSKRSST